MIINYRPAVGIAFDGPQAAGRLAGPLPVSDGIIGTDFLALTAPDTFFLVDHRLSLLKANGTSGAHQLTGMSHTTHTGIGDFIHILRAGIAG